MYACMYTRRRVFPKSDGLCFYYSCMYIMYDICLSVSLSVCMYTCGRDSEYVRVCMCIGTCASNMAPFDLVCVYAADIIYIYIYIYIYIWYLFALIA